MPSERSVFRVHRQLIRRVVDAIRQGPIVEAVRLLLFDRQRQIADGVFNGRGRPLRSKQIRFHKWIATRRIIADDEKAPSLCRRPEVRGIEHHRADYLIFRANQFETGVKHRLCICIAQPHHVLHYKEGWVDFRDQAKEVPKQLPARIVGVSMPDSAEGLARWPAEDAENITANSGLNVSTRHIGKICAH